MLGQLGYQLDDGSIATAEPAELIQKRAAMVDSQIVKRGVRDERVLKALREVPRHLFVPPHLVSHAYDDRPLAIGLEQTISQPYIVGFMTELLRLGPGARVLDVGTGSGYHAAVLSRVAARVVSVEVLPRLADEARERLGRLGYSNITVVTGDGAQGFAPEAPYDGILVACTAPRIPPELVRQLAPGGRLIIPIGSTSGTQDLIVVEKDPNGHTVQWSTIEVRFVPLTGPSGEARDE